MLLECGADPNVTDSDGYTPLYYIEKLYMNNEISITPEHQEIMDLLIEYGAKLA